MPSLQYVKPTDDQIAVMQTFRDQMSKLYDDIAALPDGRGKSLALTKLEESAMWLNKHLTNNA